MRILTPGTNRASGGFLYMDALIGIIILALVIAAITGIFTVASIRTGTMNERVAILFEETMHEK